MSIKPNIKGSTGKLKPTLNSASFKLMAKGVKKTMINIRISIEKIEKTMMSKIIGRTGNQKFSLIINSTFNAMNKALTPYSQRSLTLSRTIIEKKNYATFVLTFLSINARTMKAKNNVEMVDITTIIHRTG